MPNRLRDFWKQLRRVQVQSEDESIKDDLINDREPFEIQLEKPDSGLSDGSDGKYNLAPAQYRSALWRLAWTDGRIEHPISERLDALRYQANLELNEIIRGLKEKISADIADTQNLLQSAQNASVQADAQRDYLNRLEKSRLLTPAAFSRWFGGLYFLIALVITLSDVPLSLNLVATGFGIPSAVTLVQNDGDWVRVDEDNIRTVDPAKIIHVEVSDIFQHFALVRKFLWEPWALALGIASCGFFFKLVLGRFATLAEDEANHPIKGRFEHFRKWFMPTVYAVLLLVVGITYWQLANFRGNEQQIASLERETIAIQAQLNSSKVTDPTAELEKQLGGLTQTLDAAVLVRSRQSPTAFFWLTVTLPFVAGAFLAAGADCFSKSRRLKLLVRSVNAAETEALHLNKRATRQDHALTCRKEFVESVVNTPEYREQFIEARLAIYRHGYRRGLRVPETAYPFDSTYERCENALHRKLGVTVRRFAAPKLQPEELA